MIETSKEKIDKIPESIEHPEIIQEKIIYRFWMVLLTAICILNFDLGFLPAGTAWVKSELNISNSLFGTLGTAVFLGFTIGSNPAIKILQKFHQKTILIACILVNLGSMVAFTLIDNIYILIALRGIKGIS